jgi:CRISPR/Cas system-associated exonuclease Cas4 (RecB family)
LEGLRPDRVNWDTLTVIEEKLTASYLDASYYQGLYYCLMLSHNIQKIFNLKIKISNSRKEYNIFLDEKNILKMISLQKEIIDTKQKIIIPNKIKIPACSGCSNNVFCFDNKMEVG